MLPCSNCGKPVPADVHAEELGFCLPCSDEYWNHYPVGSCGHFVSLCCDDGNSFCPRCEGSGDFCRVCSENGHRFGQVCEGFCPSCSLGEVSA